MVSASVVSEVLREVVALFKAVRAERAVSRRKRRVRRWSRS
jgi:hypothetical protein